MGVGLDSRSIGVPSVIVARGRLVVARWKVEIQIAKHFKVTDVAIDEPDHVPRIVESALSRGHALRFMPGPGEARTLLMHRVCFAVAFARASAGSSNAASTAIIAMTTSNSIRLNPLRLRIKLTVRSLCWYCSFRARMPGAIPFPANNRRIGRRTAGGYTRARTSRSLEAESPLHAA